MNLRAKSREVSKALRQYVLAGVASGNLRPGDSLPAERQLTETFGAGRGTIRKTLQALEDEGLLIREVGRGTFISPAATRQGTSFGGLSDALGATPNQPKPPIASMTSPADVMELRLLIEPVVAELVVSRANQSEIDSMHYCLEQARLSTTLEEFEHWDDMLHRTIADASRNPLFSEIYAMISAVRLESKWGELKRRTLTEDLKRKHFEEHVHIVDAIQNRDAEGARKEMQRHMDHVRRNMFGGG